MLNYDKVKIKMWFFSTFLDSNVPEIDIFWTILNFVEIQESVVGPIRNSQSFIAITYFVTELSKKNP